MMLGLDRVRIAVVGWNEDGEGRNGEVRCEGFYLSLGLEYGLDLNPLVLCV
jgi:hypothetical protein